MAKTLKTIALVLFVAVYFVAANGIALEGAARLYSTGAQTSVAFHAGGARDLPIPSLTQRTYTPLTVPVVVLAAGFVVSAFVYPIEEPHRFLYADEALPSSTAELPPSISNRAPPSA